VSQQGKVIPTDDEAIDEHDTSTMSEPGTPTWTMKRLLVAFGALVLVAVATVACPHVVIQPFRPQDPRALALALGLVRWQTAITALCLAAAVVITIIIFRRPDRPKRRIARAAVLVAGCLITFATCLVARINVFERMFHSIGAPRFVSIDEAHLDATDMLVVIRSGSDARGYPVRALTYHHIVNDVVDGAPIAITYCSLCHTGMVWSRVVDGRTLRFHIGGINNQNMLMRDDETGTFWQQSTGLAISGPLAGRHLALALSDELSLSVFQREAPRGVVLAAVSEDSASYASADWERRMATRPSVTAPAGPLRPRDLVIGISVSGADRAFPLDLLDAPPSSPSAARPPLHDDVGDVPVILLVGEDGKSIRAFDARLEGRVVELYAAPGADWLDAETGRAWGFDGCSVTPPKLCLSHLPILRSYWFDWREHHPNTSVASAKGVRRSQPQKDNAP
jgi:hypothetical protein